MDVRVRVPTQLRELVAGAAIIVVAVDGQGDGPASVASVLNQLAALHPALGRRIRDEQGRTRAHVNLFVGADNVRDRDGAATLIKPGDELSIIPAVSGG